MTLTRMKRAAWAERCAPSRPSRMGRGCSGLRRWDSSHTGYTTLSWRDIDASRRGDAGVASTRKISSGRQAEHATLVLAAVGRHEMLFHKLHRIGSEGVAHLDDSPLAMLVLDIRIEQALQLIDAPRRYLPGGLQIPAQDHRQLRLAQVQREAGCDAAEVIEVFRQPLEHRAIVTRSVLDQPGQKLLRRGHVIGGDLATQLHVLEHVRVR